MTLGYGGVAHCTVGLPGMYPGEIVYMIQNFEECEGHTVSTRSREDALNA